MVFWVLMVFEVDLFLSAKLGAPFYRIPTLLAPVIALVALTRFSKKAMYWPLIVFVLLHLGASIIAENAGLARGPLKFMTYMMIMFVSTITVLDTPGKAHALLKLYLLSFIWFGVQGLTAAGRVTWHDLMANEDSYGPLMVMLVPLAFFFSLATTSSTWRWIGRGAFALGALGVIVSFARGAALSAAAVLLYILFRTPNKAKTFTFIMLAAIVLLPVASTLVPMDAYKAELATSTSGEDPRSALWKLAWMVFQSSPIFGVGASNYGVVGARIAPPDMAHYLGAGIYQLGVHNTHIQILAEEGLLGVALWSAMFIGIFRWCRWLRTPQAQTAWIQQGGAGLDIGKVSLGFEGATVAYICTALFYNQLYIHWLWSLLAITYMLFHLTRPGGENLHARSRNRGGPIPPHRARRVS